MVIIKERNNIIFPIDGRLIGIEIGIELDHLAAHGIKGVVVAGGCLTFLM